MTDKQKVLVPTMNLRWIEISSKPDRFGKELTYRLQQWFNDISVVKEDGSPADGLWVDVPVEQARKYE